MPPSGTATNLAPSSANYAPTGAMEIARVEIPQEMLALSAINTNDLNSVVWQVWNDIYTGTVSITSTTSGATPNEVWTAWNVQHTAAVNSAITRHIGQPINAATTSSLTNTINGEIWGAWNNQIQNLRNASAEQVRRVQEQQRQARERQDRYQADQTRVQLERSKAEKRAEKLLQELLSAEQRAELAAKGFFTLRTIAKSGEERIYRIRRGRSRNVEQVDAQGNRIKTLCAHPIEMVPDADTMLAQKLMLETPDMQEEFLRIANHS